MKPHFALIAVVLVLHTTAGAAQTSFSSAELLKQLSSRASFDVTQRNKIAASFLKGESKEGALSKVMEYPLLYGPLSAAEIDLPNQSVTLRRFVKIPKGLASRLEGFSEMSGPTQTKFSDGSLLEVHRFDGCTVTPIDFKEAMISPNGSGEAVQPYGELELVCKVETVKMVDSKTGEGVPEIEKSIASENTSHVWLSINGYPENNKTLINVKSNSLADVDAYRSTIDSLRAPDAASRLGETPAELQAELKFQQQMLTGYAPFIDIVARLDGAIKTELQDDNSKVAAYGLSKR